MRKQKRMIMFNEDNTHQFCEYCTAKVRPTPKIAEKYISQYAGSQITDYLINVNSLNSSYPSKVLESYDQRFLEKKQNGYDVDFSDTHARQYYECFIEDKYDMYAHWIELLRKINIRPWLSFRMNDCHNNSDPYSMMLSNYYHEHKELRRCAHHLDGGGYFMNCFDYAKKEVRDRMLAYIDEALDRYDVDGIELDYIREQFCFSIGGEYEGRNIMTDFIRDVNAIVYKYEEKRNKNISILVRVPRSPEDCFYEGFDVILWAKEKLVDVIVASPRWCPTDNDIPVEFWKQILDPYDVEFAAAVELIVKFDETFLLNTHETALASCYQNMSAGADFAYLFNYMRSNVTNYENPDDPVMSSILYKWDNYQHLIHNAGTLETASKCIRRHIPTGQDLAPDWKTVRKPLPITCEDPHSYPNIRIRTGEISPDSEVKLILGCKHIDSDSPLTDKDFKVWINSHKLTLSSVQKVFPEFTKNPGYVFEVKDKSILSQVNMVEVSVSEGSQPYIVDFAEIYVKPKNL